jgi:hypothetical protein
MIRHEIAEFSKRNCSNLRPKRQSKIATVKSNFQDAWWYWYILIILLGRLLWNGCIVRKCIISWVDFRTWMLRVQLYLFLLVVNHAWVTYVNFLWTCIGHSADKTNRLKNIKLFFFVEQIVTIVCYSYSLARAPLASKGIHTSVLTLLVWPATATLQEHIWACQTRHVLCTWRMQCMLQQMPLFYSM